MFRNNACESEPQTRIKIINNKCSYLSFLCVYFQIIWQSPWTF